MCKDERSKSGLEQEQEKLIQGRKINQLLLDNKQTKKASPFVQARPREENLEKRKAMELGTQKLVSLIKFLPKVLEVFPERPSTWFEAKLEKRVAELETRCNSGGPTTEMTATQKLRNKFIEECKDSMRYNQGK
ncbi:hypothetical protein RHMOL_Rhmol12G0202000 [Rhododendron molle]|uniref:Uncharacterized protein n=1 Tax=Rhododendron molle TaxID=49168 RepID=A0ACC0LKH8_RHOML|nr:hypothetical protein RHMOL_Rhmol12G0202000 [Rhododendron molle]